MDKMSKKRQGKLEDRKKRKTDRNLYGKETWEWNKRHDKQKGVRRMEEKNY